MQTYFDYIFLFLFIPCFIILPDTFLYSSSLPVKSLDSSKGNCTHFLFNIMFSNKKRETHILLMIPMNYCNITKVIKKILTALSLILSTQGTWQRVSIQEEPPRCFLKWFQSLVCNTARCVVIEPDRTE